MNNRQAYPGCGCQQNRSGYGMNPSCGHPGGSAQNRGQSSYRPSARPNCSCEKSESSKKQVMSRTQLLNYINEVSFAKDEMLLYLDTHPCDKEALEFCRKHVEMRNKALKEYAKHYGPLTIDTTDDAASESWEWVMQPWPWEGGAC